MEGKKSSDENTQSEGEPLLGGRESNNYLQCKKYLVGYPCLDGILL